MNQCKKTKFAFAEADPDMVVVSMLEFQGKIYVATQKGIYVVTEGDTLVRLELVDKTDYEQT